MVKRLRSVTRRKPPLDRGARLRFRALVERASDDLPLLCDGCCIAGH